MAIVNASMIVRSVWAMVKPLMTARTKEKVFLAGTSKKDILEILTPHIEMKVIPKHLGG